MFQSIEALL